ncbi:DUF4257 domain-containing protein [Halobacillus litoralis]|uniref:DUF4257 domain-containing protein n=1 Tax=Halobacillus litoralis TaxID=45668 RepID=A0A845FDF6_9BACI|nr:MULTISPECIES: DUF4257 domain-containing protein [Halobacillus]MBN9653196.1 DUF4257 domain-containing protein [Halobacillus sp. GSS1]MEC3884785.1 DUF4257 domain-containing protein [Halobacillus sp. HZG1]MYL71804.1 DUF4257 domain-containing protein [Halobacillus litoralis]
MNTLIIAGCIGGLTGIVAHLMRNGKVLIFPKKRARPKGIYLGFLADFFIGAAASIFAVTYLTPESDALRSLIGISILAGMTAENVLLKRELNVEKAKVEGLDRINQRLK